MSPPAATADARSLDVPCVIYAAKSTEDLRGSIATQLADCRAAIAAVGDGRSRRLVCEHVDEGKSAYRGNRGHGLVDAKAAAARSAARSGAAELWVQHSDRLARGDGIAADHLAEVFFAMRRVGVRLRSVQDDNNLEDVIRVALIGERNTEDSRRKSEAVRAGKRRQLERGERLGGPVPDGYLRVARVDGDRVTSVYELDPQRAPIVARAFELAASGLGDPTIARMLNREGHRTQAGRRWRRRRVQDMLTNAHYAGRVVRFRSCPRPEVVEGRHPALIAGDTFDGLQAQRRLRDRAENSARRPGRPNTRFLLSRLAWCARCDEGMYAVASTYRRKDGTRARHYVCPSRHDSTGGCDQPRIDAEHVDAAITAHLEGFFLDFDAWHQALESSSGARGQAVDDALDRERDRLAMHERRQSKLRDRWVQAIDTSDERLERAAFEALEAERGAADQVGQRIGELTQLAEEAQASDPVNQMLDLYGDLSRAVRGQLHRGSVADVNEGLRDLFACFWLDTLAEGVMVLPELRSDVHAAVAIDPVTRSGHLLRLDTRSDDALQDIREVVGPAFATFVTPAPAGRAPRRNRTATGGKAGGGRV